MLVLGSVWKCKVLHLEETTPNLRSKSLIMAGFFKVTGPSTLGISGVPQRKWCKEEHCWDLAQILQVALMKKYCWRQILQNLLRVFRRFSAWWTCATRTESAAGRPSQPIPADGTGRDPIANFGCPPLSPWNPIKRWPVRILLVRKLWRTWSPFWRQSLRSWRSKSASSMESNQSPKKWWDLQLQPRKGSAVPFMEIIRYNETTTLTNQDDSWFMWFMPRCCGFVFCRGPRFDLRSRNDSTSGLLGFFGVS